ncbi:hypothetical protein KDH83_02360 [Achromobacter sp. Marseille-Q0513]|uniref:DUF7661 family protein n=1 Tax=Achromobacter sp. Marseille-Q0513 TaxID=2829161 RepID=UPI001B8E596C|nr:hypothetical protein [Achromobacter sp. Marseille-Q0513]MBR8652147.1 hypothetical protein [Achromobacter sp. Marseille-Q0513]
MEFDIYGRFRLEIVPTAAGGWQAYRVAAGKRVPANGIIIPADLAAGDLAEYLDDLLHELSPPGGKIIRL